MKPISILMFILVSLSMNLFAQQNTTAAGGDATGAGGSASFSLGQIDYITETGAGGSARQGVQQAVSPCPTPLAGNVVACPGVPVNLVGTPLGGVFSISNPYLGPNTSYTYTYIDPSIGCNVTSSPATVINSTVSAPVPNPVVTGTTTATISWSVVPGATIYYLWYRPVSSFSWLTPTTTGTSINLTGLLPNTLYEYKLRCNNATCGQYGPFGTISTFMTDNAPCGTATTFITAFTTTNTTALVKWNGLAGVAQYSLWFKKTSDAAWSTLMLTGATTQYLLTGLTPNTSYDVKIRNRCIGEATFTPFGSIYTFGTPLKPSNQLSASQNEYLVFPNPSNGMIYIEYEANESKKATIQVKDMTGRLVKQIHTQQTKGMNTFQVSLKELASGNYHISTAVDGDLLFTKIIHKQN